MNTNQINTKLFFKKSIANMSYGLLIIMIWMRDVILPYSRGIVKRLPIVGPYAYHIFAAIWCVVVVASIPVIIKKLRFSDYIFTTAVVIVYALNYIFFPNNEEALNALLSGLLLKVFPLYLIGRTLDVKKYSKQLYHISCITIIVMFAFIVLYSDPSTSNTKNYMHSAFIMLPHLCMVIFYTLNKVNFYNIFVMILGIVLMFLFGCRGAVGCTLLFLCINVLFVKKFKHPFVSYSIVFVASTFIVVYFRQILHFIADIAKALHMSTRVIETAISGELFESAGRDVLTEKIIPIINENWLFGAGIGADRIHLRSYVHNIFLEFLLNFGVIIGTLLFLAVIFVIIKAIKQSPTTEERSYVLVLSVSGFAVLFLSSSYLEWSGFFFMLGYCMSIISQKKKKFLIRGKYEKANKIADHKVN